jgi:SAM-dependent MidA family methyltransferase
VGFTQQGLFLMALGLGDRIAALSSTDNARGQATAKAQDVLTIMRRREALHELMNPMGLGGFGVLIQSKGLMDEGEKRTSNGGAEAPNAATASLTLKGLTVPPMF